MDDKDFKINNLQIESHNKDSQIRTEQAANFQKNMDLQNAEIAANSMRNSMNDLARKNGTLTDQVSQSETSASVARIQRNIAQEENEKLKGILNRPLMDIVKENDRLRAAMEKQQSLLEEWMLSQKTFKVMAIKYGAGFVSDEKFAADVTLVKEQIKQGKKLEEIKLS